MGDFLCEAISECDSIDMLQRGLEHIKNKIRQLESENEIDEDDEDESDEKNGCKNCKNLDVHGHDVPCASCRYGSNFSKI